MFLDDWQADHAASPVKRKPKVTDDVTSTPTPLYGAVVRTLTDHVTHGHTVLLPNAGCEAIRQRVRSVMWARDMWMIFDELKSYEQMMNEYITCPTKRPWDCQYDLDTVWFMPFLDWCQQFDPNGEQVDAAILNSAPDRAAAELVEAWQFLRPLGAVTAILPARELFEEEEMHEWLAERWADYEFVPPEMYDKRYHPLHLCSVYITRCYSLDPEPVLL